MCTKRVSFENKKITDWRNGDWCVRQRFCPTDSTEDFLFGNGQFETANDEYSTHIRACGTVFLVVILAGCNSMCGARVNLHKRDFEHII